MQYSTKVDRTTETLKEVAQLVANLEEQRVLSAVINSRLTHDDIMEYTLRLKEKRNRQLIEIESLRKFSKSFNQEFATNHNSCFTTARRLFGIIRSNMSETLKLLKKFCPFVKSRGPVVDGVEQRPDVIGHSLLSPDVPYAPQMFGIEACDPCVTEFIKELAQFFKEVECAISICEDVISEEGCIREDSVRCVRLYEKCCDNVLRRSHEFIEYFGEQGFAREDNMSHEMKKLPSLQDFASQHFHMHNKNEFQLHVLHKTYHEGKANNLTNTENYLWPGNHTKALQARVVLNYFDELTPKGRQIGDTGQYRLSGKHVAVFMKWCEVKDTMKEKHFIEKYFNPQYKGQYTVVTYSTVNTAKNKLLRDEQGEKEIITQIEALVRKHCE